MNLARLKPKTAPWRSMKRYGEQLSCAGCGLVEVHLAPLFLVSLRTEEVTLQHPINYVGIRHN